MESVALAIPPHLAIGALVGLHPFSVAVRLETVLPHVPEAVLVNVALVVVVADAQATRDVTIGQHRGHIDARTARKVMVAHLTLLFAKEAVATIVGTNLALLSRPLDELHHLNKLLVAEFKVGFIGGTAKRKHGE